MVRVKICGITNEEDAEAAIEAGADALGFILYPPSPRYIEPHMLSRLIQGLPPFIQRVGVTVNRTLDEIERIEKTLSPSCMDLWQLHGEESEALCTSLAPRRLIRVLRLKSLDSLPHMEKASHLSAFLLETPSDSSYGGTGQVFDWNLAVAFKQKTTAPLILSGGLTPENVAQAIEKVQPYAIDVSSGVESKPGKKDHGKLKAFLQTCRSFS